MIDAPNFMSDLKQTEQADGRTLNKKNATNKHRNHARTIYVLVIDSAGSEKTNLFYFKLQVFEAEKRTAKTGLYHRRCFTCLDCKRALDYQVSYKDRPF